MIQPAEELIVIVTPAREAFIVQYLSTIGKAAGETPTAHPWQMCGGELALKCSVAIRATSF
jgi:hypothetical protein